MPLSRSARMPRSSESNLGGRHAAARLRCARSTNTYPRARRPASTRRSPSGGPTCDSRSRSASSSFAADLRELLDRHALAVLGDVRHRCRAGAPRRCATSAYPLPDRVELPASAQRSPQANRDLRPWSAARVTANSGFAQSNVTSRCCRCRPVDGRAGPTVRDSAAPVDSTSCTSSVDHGERPRRPPRVLTSKCSGRSKSGDCLAPFAARMRSIRPDILAQGSGPRRRARDRPRTDRSPRRTTMPVAVTSTSA